MENWHMLSIKAALDHLGSSKSGLSTVEAKKRLVKCGPNKLEKKRGATHLQIFLRQFKSFLIIILLIAAAISGLVGFYSGESEGFVDMLVILIIVVLNAVLGFVQECRAEQAMAALEKLTAPKATVVRDGKKIHISAEELVRGDILLLAVGDKVPADVRLLEQMNLHIDESMLTGESVPVTKSTEQISKPAASAGECKNLAYMGTVVTSGRATAVVVRTGMGTEMGKIAEMIQGVEPKQTPLQKKLQNVGKTLGIAIIGICTVVFLLGAYRGGALVESFMVAVSLAVAAVPEGLPAIITISLAIGLEKMAKNKAIVRNLPAVETLGATTVICSDKTGTLTKGEMTIREIYLDGKTVNVSGAGYEPSGDLFIGGKKLDKGETEHLNLLLKSGTLCNNADIVKEEQWSIFGDPTEGSLVVLAVKAGLDYKALKKNHPRVHEIEFDSIRKRMTTIHKTPEGEFVAFAKGASEVLLDSCSRIYANGTVRKITAADKKKIREKTQGMAKTALRVLAVAYREVPPKIRKFTPEAIESNMIFLGLVGMIDPPRAEVREALGLCKNAGIRTLMITGDHKLTAETIAKDLGMIGPNDSAVSGEELDKISDDELLSLVRKSSVYARVSPEHKVRILKALQANNEIVAMTGDGVNDAPALKNADIGIAMGISGTDVSKEAADMVLQDDNFATIVKAVEEGRAIYNNIKKFIALLLSGNIGEILIIALGVLIGFTDPATGMFVLPLLAVQILWINLLTDGLPAVALSMEPAEEGIMKQKPRDPKESLFSGLRAYVVEYPLLMFFGVIALFLWTLNSGGGVMKAQTMAFTAIVMFELFQSYSCRSLDKPVAKLNPLSNKFLLLAIATSLISQLCILYVPFLQAAFHTVALGIFDWGVILVVASLGFIYLECYKIYKAKRRGHNEPN